MINVYVDEGIKDAQLFKQILESSCSDIFTFSKMGEIAHDQVDVAVIWLNVPACLKEFSSLRLLLTCGSGVDHIVHSRLLLESVTTVRLVDEKLRNKVADYVINAVEGYKVLINESDSSRITVGIMGLGLIGETTLSKLKQLNYNVLGWAKSKTKKRSFSNYYIGMDSLTQFATQSQVIVCHLPLTEDTEHILDKHLFSFMPKDGYIINVGRGGHLNENDLIEFVCNGHLKGGCLDVFKIEPLPEQHVLQNQPRIKLTPHIAGGIFPEEQAKYALEVIDKFFNNGGNLEGVVDYRNKY